MLVTIRRVMRSGAIVLLAVAALVAGGCASSSDSPGGGGGSGDNGKKSVAEKLATIQKQAPVEANDPLVRNFDAKLDALQKKCKDRRIRLADFAVTARKLLKKDGVDESLSSIVTHANQSIPAAAPRMPCAYTFAAYVALRTSG